MKNPAILALLTALALLLPSFALAGGPTPTRTITPALGYGATQDADNGALTITSEQDSIVVKAYISGSTLYNNGTLKRLSTVRLMSSTVLASGASITISPEMCDYVTIEPDRACAQPVEVDSQNPLEERPALTPGIDTGQPDMIFLKGRSGEFSKKLTRVAVPLATHFRTNWQEVVVLGNILRTLNMGIQM